MYSSHGRVGDPVDSVTQKNLPNKRHIGKQDPYASITFNGEKKRTKAIKRGGQHPEWDEEFRYTLCEDPNDASTIPLHGDATPPPPPPKKSKGPPTVKGGRSMLVACFAEDPREPDFIGETNVDLTEVLTKGETDGTSLASIIYSPSNSCDRVVHVDE